MSRTLLLMFCVLIALLVLACATHDTNRNANANATVTASADQIGVPECDNFINTYENCVTTKVPEAARPQFQTTMATWRAEWKRLAADPQTRNQLVIACKNHMELARTQMKSYGCTF